MSIIGADVFSIGLSGLNAAQNALSITGNNISNVNTAGYNAEYMTQASRTPVNAGFGYLGQGVDATSVLRTYNQYLTSQVQTTQAANSNYSTQYQQLQQISNMIQNTTQSVSPAIQNFFSAMQTLTQQPNSVSSRQTVLGMAQNLATTMTSMNSQLVQIQQGVNGQIQSTAQSINSIAQQIAALNQQIGAATGGNPNGSQPNTLLDQRDQAVTQLNQLVGASVSKNSDGSYNISIAGGQPLVVGTSTYALQTQQDPNNPSNYLLNLAGPNNTLTPLPDNLFNGGQLTGLLNFRDGQLSQTQNQLGSLAINFSAAMNYQNSVGMDLKGNVATGATVPIFQDLSAYASKPQYAAGQFAVVMSDPTALACASNLAPTGGAGGTGVTMSGVWSTIPGSVSTQMNQTPPVLTTAATHPSIGMTNMTISASATNPVTMTATIAGGSAAGGPYNVVVDPNLPNAYKIQTTANPAQDLGIGFQLSGNPANGQTFTVGQATSTAQSGDGNNLRQLTAQQNINLVNGQSYQGYYSTMVASVGSTTSTVNLQYQTSQTALQQAQTNNSNASGVNLDQEAANLIKYQQSYQACSKVIQIAQSTFSTILNALS
ncbi:flagellar hook-associated protein FlgK [Chromobacterium sp. IIBBL 290-4]|uniref:flagellar hook-associated protein FlgK n=1 Tax=Chromobacterium sp. IIBBL 290-4 TaxID=2953890 RepID=UPI0020B8B73A|nr:flagellar hook-associated protein FlgK [Chromobacterium sp. IIBBL 290-4]UTH73838.1 flagellar hook-associated protein FlgK [Chromobacterium sp. IIBBL 290-4]